MIAVKQDSESATWHFYQVYRKWSLVQPERGTKPLLRVIDIQMNTIFPSSTMLATDRVQSVRSQTSATAQQFFAYTPYGHRSHTSGSASLLGFNGARLDPATRHYPLGNGYRAYNPVLMRFTRPDKFSPFAKGGLNCYAYCNGDPVNAVDPAGTMGLFGMLPAQEMLTFSRRARSGLTSQQPTTQVAKSTRYQSMAPRQVVDKTVETFPDFSEFMSYGEDAFSFADNGSFNFSAHGPGPGRVVVGGKELTTAQLFQRFQTRGERFSRYSCARLLYCHSGTGGTRSAAQQFATLSGLPTQGRLGGLWDNSLLISEYAQRWGEPSKINRMARQNFLVYSAYSNTAPERANELRMVEDHHRTAWFFP